MRFQSFKRIGETTLCPIFNLNVESSTPRLQCFEEHLTSTDRLRKYVISPDNLKGGGGGGGSKV